MTYRSSNTTYGLIAILFHWFSAMLVIGLFISGLWMVSLNYYSRWYQLAPYYHKSFGLLLVAIIILRLLWRVFDNKPAPIGTRFEVLASKLVHWALYALLIAIFVSGYLIATGDGRPVSFFGIIQIPSILNMKGIEIAAGNVHFYAAWALVILAFLHAVAAIKHHYINKDQVLRRMLGRTSS